MRSPQKVLLVFCTGIFLIHTAFSQTILIPFRDKNQWGFADTNGHIKITPAWDRVDLFNYSKTLTRVRKDNLVGLIDTSGKLLFPLSNRFEPFGKNYQVTRQGKKGIYSPTGKALVPCEYDAFEWKDATQAYGIKDNVYFLVSYKTGAATKTQQPVREIISGEAVVAPPETEDDDELGTVPYPQLPASDFPRLKGYTNLVHSNTIWQDRKPVFYLFRVVRDRKLAGYVGENGIQFFKD